MKQFITFILCIVVICGVAAGCGGPDAAGNVSTTDDGFVNGVNSYSAKDAVEDLMPPETYDIVPAPDENDGSGMIGNK